MDDCPIQPLNGFIVILHIPTDLKTESGLYMPENARETMQKGKCMATFGGLYFDKECKEWITPTVKVKDVVLFHKANATHFKIGTVDYFLIKESNLYGILK